MIKNVYILILINEIIYEIIKYLFSYLIGTVRYYNLHILSIGLTIKLIGDRVLVLFRFGNI